MVARKKRQPGDYVISLILVSVGLVSVVPLLVVASMSLTPYGEVLRNGGYVLFPHHISFDGYREVLSNPAVLRALSVTAFVTVVGTAVNMVLTTCIAYPLARRDLVGRRLFLLGILFTMFFSAGMIPTYLIVQATGLVDTVWAMIIPNAVSIFNVLIMKTFFEALPTELLEAARIDGAGELRILRSIVLPLSVPVMLTLGLFYTVGHWNEFYSAVVYIRDQHLYPLQLVIYNMLQVSQSTEASGAVVPTVTMQMAAIVIAAAPMIAVYPFIQKYFQKGVMIGAVKG